MKTFRGLFAPLILFSALLAGAEAPAGAAAARVSVDGEIRDAETGVALPARIYVRSASGTWHFPKIASAAGSAIRYERQRPNTAAIEMHTTLSAHPFRVELEPGRYTFTVERGKEYRPETREVVVARATPRQTFRLHRWVDMAKTGWFSGDTHVHRDSRDLANVMLAEDVNVVLPMVDWTTESHVSPRASAKSAVGDFGGQVVAVDAAHVWFPRNTEYEIFRTENRSHQLGAFLIVNHRTRFDQTLFPLADIVRQARAEGALLDLEKHNWPWSIALVPILNIDLFELGNNHHWPSEYGVKKWAVPAPAWMQLAGTGTDTEHDWTLYGFKTYYALLNCGFKLRPAAGTANGVHPVPLGYSRVYVQLDGPFSYEAWMRGLGAGRSFVTTGPMLRAKAAGQWPGATLAVTDAAKEFALHCEVRSEHPLESIELIENGEVLQRFTPANQADAGAFANEVAMRYRPKGSAWLTWRCFEQRPGGRFRFAHTAPWYFTVAGQSLRPRRDEAAWLVARVKEEIARTREVAPASLIDEYQRALKIYEELAARAR